MMNIHPVSASGQNLPNHASRLPASHRCGDPYVAELLRSLDGETPQAEIEANPVRRDLNGRHGTTESPRLPAEDEHFVILWRVEPVGVRRSRR